MIIGPERVKLLFGPYQPPRLRKGDRVFCLSLDRPVVVVGMSPGPIPWPTCMQLEPPRKGPRRILVEEELARAVRNESTEAVAYWWGVHRSTVHKWRRALGVTRKNNRGTHRLILGAIKGSLQRRFGNGDNIEPDGSVRTCQGRAAVWSPEEIALLGAMTDTEVSKRTGRSLGAINKKREALGRPALAEGLAGPHRRFWSPAEDEAARTLTAEEVARRIGRSRAAVEKRRQQLKQTEHRRLQHAELQV